MIGKTISHYKIIDKLGEGAYTTIYVAEDLNVKKKVSLKILPRSLISDKEVKARFTRGAHTASAIDHVNVIKIYEIGETKDTFFISMEYIEGKSLKEIIQQKPLPLEKFFNIAIQIAEGLLAVHEERITHMNLKSTNIMITNDGIVKLIDFALAVHEDAITKKDTYTVAGTLLYMSPEQIQGLHVDQRTDIYSLGVVLYEMLTGRTPFEKKLSEHELIYAKLNEATQPPSELNPEIPKIVEKIIMKTLKVDFKHRYQTVEHMMVDLIKVFPHRLLTKRLVNIDYYHIQQRSLTKSHTSPILTALLEDSIIHELEAFLFEHKLWRNISIGFLFASVGVMLLFPILSIIGILGSIGLYSSVITANKKWGVKIVKAK